ncbi:hypothetical protein ABIF68_002508 [Bradyrhizobium japonicum]
MGRLAKLAVFSGLIASCWVADARGREMSDPVVDAVIAGPMEKAGQWRTKVQLVFEATSRTLVRRTFSVWDAMSARDLDFTWKPDDPKRDMGGRINGSGHLVWRIRSQPAYDPSSIVAEYRGSLRDGRMEGRGVYAESAGLKYEGQWRDGLMNGRGTLQLPTGDEYVGRFAQGKANGDGRLIDMTGEIFEGNFVDGRKHGLGKTTLPNGASYLSSWTRGQESERSRFVRVAQSGNSTTPGISDDVRIGIAVDKRLPPQVNASKDALWYEVANSPAGFQIRPGDSRLLKLWREKPELQLSFEEEVNEDRPGIVSLTKEQLVPLNLRVELQNRSSSPIQMTGLYLDVASSTTETKPAIQVKVGTVDLCFANAAFSSGFTLENFGWGTAEDVALKFDLAGPKGGSNPIRISKKPGNLDKTLRVDIESDLKSMGVDTDYLKGLKQGFACSKGTPARCLTSFRATGKLGPIANFVEMQDTTFVVKFASSLDYTWRDAKGEMQKWTHPFTATLPLGFLSSQGECGELGAPQIVTNKSQQFKLDSTGYKIPIAYQATVPPTRTIPLVFPIEAQKSSTHDFSIVIQLADGREIRSRPVNLLYYRPRWFSEPQEDHQVDDSDGIYLSGFSLNGAELRKLQDATGARCPAACDADLKCVGYSADGWTNQCALMSQVTSMRRDPRVYSTLKKGANRPVVAADAAVLERYSNKKFDGPPFLVALSSTLDECEKNCRSEEDCAAFNFVTTTNICYLISSLYKKPVTSPATESGIRFQPAH